MVRRSRQKSPLPDHSEEDLTEPANDIDPYAILSLEHTATNAEIKAAYRRCALKHHPDKATQDHKEEAHHKFQEIATAYAILSDEKRRSRYDKTGNTAESLDDDDFDWADFFREQSEAMVNADVIDQIKKEYQGSAEEVADVLEAYEAGEGDMDFIYETVICSNVLDDDERFRRYIQDAMKAGTVTSYAKFTRESKDSKRKRLKTAASEAQEAIELAKELGVEEQLFGKGNKRGRNRKNEGDDALKALISQRQQQRQAAFFDTLESKYANPRKSKRRTMEEPPEEAFKQNRKRTKSER